ncbi:MAG: membrane protein insertion efficiency factor YidD, partial [Endomicrobiia bacterium]
MVKKFFIFIIKTISLFLHYILPYPKCRFTPTCSEYFSEAIENFGIFTGS